MTGSARHATGLDFAPYVTLAIRGHGIREQDVRACLLFGSHARGFATPQSDIDLILIAVDGVHTSFEYKRFRSAHAHIDSNLTTLEQLGEKCGEDVGWSYRLYGAVALEPFSADSIADVRQWLDRTNAIIASETACLFRAEVHLRDLARLRRIFERAQGLPALRGYLASEIAGLVPLAVVSLAGDVAFKSRYPGQEARKIVHHLGENVAAAFGRFEHALAATRYFGAGGQLSYAAVRAAGQQARRVIERAWPDAMGRGHQAVLKRSWPALRRLDRSFEEAGARQLVRADALVDAFDALMDLLGAAVRRRRRAPLQRSSSIATIAIHTEQSSETPRLISYSPARRRLKAILPTGGCRTPACTFCMLPLLARPKMDVAAFVRQMDDNVTGPIEKIAVYTDGSFFDDRELSDAERRTIAEAVARWRASELLVESLPRFVSNRSLEPVLRALGRCTLRIGVGLQSTNMLVRRVVTGTPVTDQDFGALLWLRRRYRFRLRVYLLAGKCLMSRFEDRDDVLRSLGWLDRHLGADDVVTINPLLPTVGTRVQRIEQEGFFAPLTAVEATQLSFDVRAGEWRPQVEFGRLYASTCTTVVRHQEARNEFPYLRENEAIPLTLPFGPGTLPWVLLGTLEDRERWLLAFESLKR